MKRFCRLQQLSVLVILAMATQANADTYHRFWRGAKRADLDWAQFQTGLNQVFIPATVRTGAGKGMTAYEPVLLEGVKGLPDEIALVSYADQAAYNALYSTDAGKAYQNLHWDYFDRPNSHSLVPQAFTGSAEIDKAYDLHPQYSGWMENTTTVLAYFRKQDEVSADFLKRAQDHLARAFSTDPKSGILDRAVLISQDYWLEYVSAPAMASKVLKKAGADLVVPVLSKTPTSAHIVPGQGVNLQF